MVKIVEATVVNGMLKPSEDLHLREDQRVIITIQTLADDHRHDRQAALERLLKGQRETNFRSTGAYPTREELHERH